MSEIKGWVKEDKDLYAVRVIDGVNVKYLKTPPYRFGIRFIKHIQKYVNEDGTYNMNAWDSEDVTAIALKNLVVEPKITDELLDGDSTPIGLLTLGFELVKMIMNDDSLKDITGLKFGDDDVDVDVDDDDDDEDVENQE